MHQASRPIMHYIKHTIEMYAVKKTVRFDRNQPHVLKYSADDKSKHTGVEVSSKCVIFWLCVAQCIPHILFFCAHKNTTQLHHDKCDVTANIMLSRSNEYTGGGWVTWGRVIFIYCVLSNFNYNIATSLFFFDVHTIHPSTQDVFLWCKRNGEIGIWRIPSSSRTSCP